MFSCKNKKNDQNDVQEPSMICWWFIAIIICIVVWGGGAFVTHWFAKSCFTVGENDNAPALFGDSFGAVNALISAFAFAGMIVTFVLQRYELSLQRNELKEQRDEFSQQNSTLKLQRFENTFFNMLDLQQQIVNELSFDEVKVNYARRGNANEEPNKRVSFHGREVFEKIYNNVKHKLKTEGIRGYKESYIRTVLDHYFRNFYIILKFIHETKVFSDESQREEGQTEYEAKYRYATILRASLSRYELVLLYYNGLSDVGNEKLKPLLEEYCMLNNINEGLLVLNKDTREMLQIPSEIKCVEVVLSDYSFSGGDYEALLTLEENNRNKYNIKAFCHSEEELENTKAILDYWNNIISEIVNLLNNENNKTYQVGEHIYFLR